MGFNTRPTPQRCHDRCGDQPGADCPVAMTPSPDVRNGSEHLGGADYSDTAAWPDRVLADSSWSSPGKRTNELVRCQIAQAATASANLLLPSLASDSCRAPQSKCAFSDLLEACADGNPQQSRIDVISAGAATFCTRRNTT